MTQAMATARPFTPIKGAIPLPNHHFKLALSDRASPLSPTTTATSAAGTPSSGPHTPSPHGPRSFSPQGGLPAHKNLYILNLPLDATTDQLAALFGHHGTVVHCVILAMLDAQARRRGFIDMASPSEARTAIESLNGYVWNGYPIEVSYAIVQRSGGPLSGPNIVRRNVPRSRWNCGPRRQPLHDLSAQGVSGMIDYGCSSDMSLNMDDSKIQHVQTVESGENGSDNVCIDPFTIFITGLDPAAILDDEDLANCLQLYGRIIACSLSRDERGISLGYGVATFGSPHEASAARNALDGQIQNGKRLSCKNLHFTRASMPLVAGAGMNAHWSPLLANATSAFLPNGSHYSTTTLHSLPSGRSSYSGGVSPDSSHFTSATGSSYHEGAYSQPHQMSSENRAQVGNASSEAPPVRQTRHQGHFDKFVGLHRLPSLNALKTANASRDSGSNAASIYSPKDHLGFELGSPIGHGNSSSSSESLATAAENTKNGSSIHIDASLSRLWGKTPTVRRSSKVELELHGVSFGPIGSGSASNSASASGSGVSADSGGSAPSSSPTKTELVGVATEVQGASGSLSGSGSDISLDLDKLLFESGAVQA